MARLDRQRNWLEIALAILTGTPAPQFSVAAIADYQPALPAVPPSLPSELLERRPDIASAERQLAAANARIGVAKAGFFPVLRLTGSAGYASAELDSLFNWDSRVGSIGPSLSLPIFAGGRNRANLARARGAFEEATAKYRQQILVAFGEVQDYLTALRLLSVEADAVGRMRVAANRTFEYANARYEGGIVSYLEGHRVPAYPAPGRTRPGKSLRPAPGHYRPAHQGYWWWLGRRRLFRISFRGCANEVKFQRPNPLTCPQPF